LAPRTGHFKKTVRFVSAPCSSGKTRAACVKIAEHRYLTNHLYVAPSLALVDQTRQQLEVFGVTADVITGGTYKRNVKAEIIRYLKKPPEVGAVLLITWQAYVDLAFFPRREAWTIVIDEVPSVDSFYRPMLPRNAQRLSDHLKLLPLQIPDVALVEAHDASDLKQLLDEPRDEMIDVLRQLFVDVLSGNKHVYVDVPSWTRLVVNGEVSKVHEKNRVYFLSMLRPEPLLGATLLGANVEDTLLYHWFRSKKVRFEREEGITNRLRSLSATLGERAHISYFLPGRPFSKYLSVLPAGTGRTLIDEMDALAVKEFGAEPFVFFSNVHRHSAIDGLPNAKKVSIACQGLNSLQGYHKLYFSAAINREPKHFAMLNGLGLNPDLAHRATAHEAIYQAVMRTSLRKPNSTEQVHVIVPDEASARRLGALLDCSNIDQLGNLLPQPKTPLSQTEKSRRYQLARVKKSIFFPQDIPDSPINENGMDPGKIEPPFNPSCSVTFHKSLYDKSADDFRVKHYEIHDFIGLLRGFANNPVLKKDELFLWNPAVFDPAKGDGYRTQANFDQSFFLVLDFDGGTLSPEAFEDIFWHEAERGFRHSFIICNSFSHSPDTPNKYRVVFFYRQPARSIEEHKAAYAYIVRRLEEAGHTEASSKLDSAACKSGVQSFWMPSTNREYPESAFFRTRGAKTVKLERYALDPRKCPCVREYEEPEVKAGKVPGAVLGNLQAEIETAEVQLRSMASGRNELFFYYGLLLARAGYDRSQIETKLREIAGSEAKMRKKIPGVLRSLANYGWF
jgi:hypothetical protein